jgi:hypothetical protein
MKIDNGNFFAGAVQVKEEGLPADLIARLKSYQTVKDVPFKVCSSLDVYERLARVWPSCGLKHPWGSAGH